MKRKKPFRVLDWVGWHEGGNIILCPLSEAPAPVIEELRRSLKRNLYRRVLDFIRRAVKLR